MNDNAENFAKLHDPKQALDVYIDKLLFDASTEVEEDASMVGADDEPAPALIPDSVENSGPVSPEDPPSTKSNVEMLAVEQQEVDQVESEQTTSEWISEFGSAQVQSELEDAVVEGQELEWEEDARMTQGQLSNSSAEPHQVPIIQLLHSDQESAALELKDALANDNDSDSGAVAEPENMLGDTNESDSGIDAELKDELGNDSDSDSGVDTEPEEVLGIGNDHDSGAGTEPEEVLGDDSDSDLGADAELEEVLGNDSDSDPGADAESKEVLGNDNDSDLDADAELKYSHLKFRVAGLNLVTPFGYVHGDYLWPTENITEIDGPQWLLGEVMVDGHCVKLVDIAPLVIPSSRYAVLLSVSRPAFKHVLMLNDTSWGIACDKVEGGIDLQAAQIQWRSERGTRPWLAGTIISEKSALLDINAILYFLEHGRWDG
ncbi:MAG: hypothetical protein GY807_08975 [Gammaproteobacteria bacterium]|nr:hypothetical protein [Gammaproteobacteria bacterium]